MSNHPLLEREAFRAAVFARDGQRCVICGQPAQDAHHIIERRLWGDGGYYLDNGVSLCGPCHIEAEQTVVSCDQLRVAAKINSVLLPEHLYRDQAYDKWGNPILPNGQRLRGELFQDASVQKILAPVLNEFTNRVKYPRTYHLPWSPGVTKDDRVLTDLSPFVGQPVVVTVKMDGECTTFYRDYVHARSIEYNPHPSRDWVKALHGRVAYDIPEGWRVCGENLYAKHSIHYIHLEDYFQVFSVWNERNECLSWAETVEWAALLGLKTVPLLWQGVWDEEKIRGLFQPFFAGDQMEGYVARLAAAFPYGAFRRSVGKFVRAHHVQTHAHWIQQIIVPNLRVPIA